MSNWLSAFFGEFEGKSLQKTGRLTREQVIQFFEHGSELFSNMEFKRALNKAAQSGQSAQELINQAQAKVWEDKVQPAVQGDFGIGSLQYVLSQYGNDVDFTRIFYQFVHLEEKTLDEAEMQPEDFAAKYQQLNKMKEVMELQMQEHEDKMKGMSEEERQKFVAQMYKTLVEQGLTMSGDPCCPPSGSMFNPGYTPPANPTEAPQVEELTSMRGPADLPAGAAPAGARVLTEAENMAFFKSISNAPR